jgi:uncharacterized protein involved in exopolysaccharide biosynthesis
MERNVIAEYVRVIWGARYAIAAMVVVASVVAFLVGNAQPKIYTATATILAPRDSQQSSVSSALGALLGGGSGGKDGGLSFPGVQVSMPGISSSLDVFNTLIMSRSMREEVLSEFSKQRGAQVLGKFRSVGSSYNKERTSLSVIVHATDPQLAADMANAYFDFLDRRLQRTAENQARRQEVFYRAQLDRAAREVDVAEDALLKFQQENRLIGTIGNIDPSARAGAEAGGSLRGAIMGLELQREVMRMRYTEQHPQMQEIDKQIAELKKQYSKNLFGQAMELPPEGPGARGPRKEFFVSTEKMTPTQLAYLKLLRNLKIQEAFYTGALQGLENMRYATEAGRPQSIEMLDPAIVPSGHVSPNVMFIVLAAAVAALAVGALGALVREYIVQTWAATHPEGAVPARPRRRGQPNGGPNGSAVPHPPVKPEAIV